MVRPLVFSVSVALALVFLVWLFFAGLVAFMSGDADYAVGVIPPTQEAQSNHMPDIPLAAIFAGWYGYNPNDGSCQTGLGSFHWNDNPNTAGVIYQPDQGYYCSSDPATIAWQVDKMRVAGINTLFFSWWGWGDSNLDNVVEGHPDQYMNNGLTALLDYIQSTGLDMKVAVIVEPFTLTQAGIEPSDLTDPQRQMVLDYLWDNYYNVYPNQMFQWEGKPLVITFDPMFLVDDNRFTIKKWTGRERNEATEGEGWQWFFAPPNDVIANMSDDGVVFIYPRFDEWYLVSFLADYITWEPRRVDPQLEDGIYEQQWQQLVDNKSLINLVVLYSWNLYGEQAHIEPSSGGPSPVLEDYLSKTQRYYTSFLAGQDIETYSQAWANPKELLELIQPIAFSELDFANQGEFNLFLSKVLRRAQSHVEGYLRKTYTPAAVPEAVKEVTLRLGANLYNYLLKVRRGPLVQVGEFEVRLIDDSVFTPALRRDLRPFRRDSSVLGMV